LDERIAERGHIRSIEATSDIPALVRRFGGSRNVSGFGYASQVATFRLAFSPAAWR
jgi:hypothetical protein